MTTDEIVKLLTAERDRLNIAIAALQGASAPKRRGRPPKNPTIAAATPAPARATRRRPKRTKAQRDAQAERMRKYWADRKKRESKGKASA